MPPPGNKLSRAAKRPTNNKHNSSSSSSSKGHRDSNNAHDQLTINHEYAERYDASKRREILRSTPVSLLPQQGEQEEESSSSEEEDEFGELLTKKIDRKVREAYEAIRRKDPKIYDANTKFFSHEVVVKGKKEEEGEEEEQVDSDDEPVVGWDTIANAAKKSTPKLTMKDYVRENLLTHGNLADDDEEEEEEAGEDYGNYESHNNNEEEEEGDDDDDDDDDDLFQKKEKSEEEIQQEQEELEKFIVKNTKKQISTNGDNYLLHSYLEKETPDEKERFLRDFVLNNGWIDQKCGQAPSGTDYEMEIDLPIHAMNDDKKEDKENSDEDFNDQVDEYERERNFRFEDGKEANEVKSYGRGEIKDSLRRPDERRKRARKAREERKKAEKMSKDHEMNRVRNVKKKEIETRLLAIEEAAGQGIDVSHLDLDGDFDADQFNRDMERHFGDAYYAEEDKAIMSDDDHDHDHDNGNAKTKTKTKTKVKEDKEKLENLMKEYSQLNYEDIIGDTPVKFKYKKVDAESFNMSAKDILEMEDKELNQLVSLKYLAPYRANRDVSKQAWKVRNQLRNRRGHDEEEEEEEETKKEVEKKKSNKRKRSESVARFN